MEFDQDSAFDLENLLARIFAVRFRRGIGPNFVNTVLSAAASSGQTVIGDDNQTSPNPATQVGVADLFNLANALDPSYAESDRCGWVMNWKTLLYLLNLRDKNGRRMLPTDRDAAGRLTIFEKPVFVSPSMQDIGHSQKPILFGALDRIIVREVTNSLAIKRFSERYAEFAAVSFEGFWRLDCGLQRTQLSRSPVTYSPSPVLYLQNS
jgi:HK97 family phage major capsid protein